nr:hypothetical protein [Tanacetum cinerariifolium]
EEIALVKGWLAISENSKDGNTKKKQGFWCEVFEYIESKTKEYGRRTYDAVLGKWKTVRPFVIRFSGIYSNVMRMAQESGVEEEDYVQRAMIHYETETGIPFKLFHCWEILKDRPKWQEIALPKFSTGSGGSKRHKSSSSSSFNAESGEASINLNTNVDNNAKDDVLEVQRPEGGDKARAKKNESGEASINLNTNVDDNAKDDVLEVQRPEGRDKARAARKKKGLKESGSSSVNEDALARMMVTEMTTQEK